MLYDYLELYIFKLFILHYAERYEKFSHEFP
jgi:hypothetical protein